MTAAGEVTSPGGYSARLVRATLRDIDALIDDAMTVGASRPTGAGITHLTEWMLAHEHRDFLYGSVFSSNLETTERLLRVSFDLAESTSLLLETNQSPSPSPFVLTRSLGEAAMRLCYLFDTSVSPARTVARMVAYQLDQVEGNLGAVEAFGPHAAEDRQRVEEAVAGTRKVLTEHGFELTLDRGGRTAVISIDGERENLQFNATDAFKKFVPGSPWIWHVGSGVTHSRGWMLAGLIPTLESEGLTSAVEGTVAVAHFVLELADAVARVAAAHSGCDAEGFLKRNHLRRLGLSSLTRPGGASIGHREFAEREHGWTHPDVKFGNSFYRRKDNR